MFREPAPHDPSPLARARQNSLKNKDLSIIKTLGPLARPYTRLLALGIFCIIVAGGTVLALGQVFRHVVDSGLQAADSAALWQGLAILMGLVGLLAVSSYGRLVILAGLAEQIIADLRLQVLRHLLGLDLAWFEKQKTGDLLSRLTADTSLLQVLIGTSVPLALRNIVMVIGSLVLMLISSPSLSALMFAVVPFILIVLRVMGPHVRSAGKLLQDKIGSVGAQLAESLTAMREIQAFTREQAQHALFAAANKEAVTAGWAYMRRRGLLSATIIVVIFSSIAGLLWFGGKQVMHGTLSAGQLTAFMFYALLVAGSAGGLSEIFGDLQRAAGALERLHAIQITTPAITTASIARMPAAAPRNIHFNDVTFAYPTRPDINVFDKLQLTLELGQHIALVGPSGAGKSTFFDLLLRFYDPTTGAVTLDDSDIRMLDLHAYRALFALVPQDPTLFSISIADNIRFGLDADQDSLEQAARMAGAHEFIAALPDGYDTLLGERGTRLSGGQIQRLALARALLRKAPVLLLDEATAHLDSTSEQLVQQQLAQRSKGQTIITIAHRLSTVQQADRIIVLEQGRIVGDGTHQELLKDCTLYSRLTQGQLQA